MLITYRSQGAAGSGRIPHRFYHQLYSEQRPGPGFMQIIQSYFAAVGINMSSRQWIRPPGQPMSARTSKTSYVTAEIPPVSPSRHSPILTAGVPVTHLAGRMPVIPNGMRCALRQLRLLPALPMRKNACRRHEYMARQHWVISSVTPNFFALYQPWFKVTPAKSSQYRLEAV